MIFKRFSKFYQPNTGLVADPRLIEDKEKDYRSEEVLSFVPPKWVEKKPEQWRKFPIFSQNQSGSCVGQTYAKLLGVDNFLEEGKFVHYSARDIYEQRLNKPDVGMWSQDAAHICHKKGVSLEQLMPSQNMTEVQMNDASDRRAIDRQIALIGKAGGYLSEGFNFDALASIIERTKKGIAIACWFNSGDWASGEVITRKDGAYGHLVAVVDYCLRGGKKALVFDNSWDYRWGFNGQGVLVEGKHEGVKDYCVYLEDLHNNWRDDPKQDVEKPKFVFEKDLGYGMRNTDVIILQKALRYFEFFPINQETTGYYGTITAKGVLGWQKKYEVLPDRIPVLEELAGKHFGPKSRIKMNALLK